MDSSYGSIGRNDDLGDESQKEPFVTLIGIMVALLTGSALVRALVRTTGSSVARKTDSVGYGCLVAVLVLIVIAVVVALF